MCLHTMGVVTHDCHAHPSRRKAYNLTDGHSYIGCMGKKKSKRKIMYSSHHSGEFENYDVVLYEPVMQVENFQYRSLVLIGESMGGSGMELNNPWNGNVMFVMIFFFLVPGAPNIGRRSLKTRLLSEWPDKFSEVKARESDHTSV